MDAQTSLMLSCLMILAFAVMQPPLPSDFVASLIAIILLVHFKRRPGGWVLYALLAKGSKGTRANGSHPSYAATTTPQVTPYMDHLMYNVY